MELKPCPFCGEVPTSFDTISNGKWGFVQCCISGPEVRASYAPLEEWRDRAVAEWNDRKAPVPSAPVAEPAGFKLVPVELTPEMRAAWDTAPYSEDLDEEMRSAYRAMIDAAPVAK